MRTHQWTLPVLGALALLAAPAGATADTAAPGTAAPAKTAAPATAAPAKTAAPATAAPAKTAAPATAAAAKTAAPATAAPAKTGTPATAAPAKTAAPATAAPAKTAAAAKPPGKPAPASAPATAAPKPPPPVAHGPIEKTRPAAIEYAKAGRFADAGEAFEGAYAATSDPDDLFDAGVAWNKAGDAVRGTAALKRYLVADPKGKSAARARELIVSMKAGLAKVAGVGTLVITTSVTGAVARIDGHDAGTTPISADLPAGDHTVQVEKAGYLVYSAPVTVAPGELTSLTVKLDRDPSAPLMPGAGDGTAAGSGSAAASAGAVDPDALSAPVETASTPVTKRRWFWPVVGGAAGIALVLTLVAVIRPVARVPEGTLGRQEFRR